MTGQCLDQRQNSDYTAREVGWSDHSRVRMSTIAKSEAITVRLQKVCMA
jgi:hypothetical protein